MFKPNISITEEELLKKISQKDIYEFYLNIKVQFNTNIFRPWQKEKTPSCRFLQATSGDILLTDFGGQTYNCISVITKLYNETRQSSINRIFKDALKHKQLILNPAQQKVKKVIPKESKIEVSVRKWNEYDKNFWLQYNIDLKILKKFEVYPIYRFWWNGNQIFTKGVLYCYYYRLYQKTKVYAPFNLINRFYSDCSNSVIQGYEQLPPTGDLLFITSSLKDIMTLYSIGYCAVAPNSENTDIPISIIKELKERFTTVIIYYNNDKAGILNSIKYSIKWGVSYMTHPTEYEEKDPSDFVKYNSPLGLKHLINYLKQKNYAYSKSNLSKIR